MNIYSLDLRVYATAYIQAGSPEEAIAKLKDYFGEAGPGVPNTVAELEFDEGPAGDFEISGYFFGSEDAPEISLSPAMSVYAPDWDKVTSKIECQYEDGDEIETCDECGAHLDGIHEAGCPKWDTF